MLKEEYYGVTKAQNAFPMNKAEEKENVLERRKNKSGKQSGKRKRESSWGMGEEGRRFQAGNFVTDPQTTMGNARV